MLAVPQGVIFYLNHAVRHRIFCRFICIRIANQFRHCLVKQGAACRAIVRISRGNLICLHTIAVCKGIRSNILQRARNGNALGAVTRAECILSNGYDAFRYIDIFQRTAAPKCAVCNPRHSIRNSQRFHAASVKRTSSDVRHTIADVYRIYVQIIPWRISCVIFAIVVHLSRALNEQRAVAVQLPREIVAAGAALHGIARLGLVRIHCAVCLGIERHGRRRILDLKRFAELFVVHLAGRRVIAVIEIQILSVFRRADRGAVLGNGYGSGLYFGSARILDAERRAVFVVRAGAEAHLYLSAQRRILVVDQRDIKIGNRFLHLHQRNVKNRSAHMLCDFPFQIRMGFHKQIDFTVQTACARMNGFAVCRSCRADFRRCRKVAARLHAQFSLDNVLQKFNAQRDFRANLHLKFRFSANVIYVEGL